MIVLYRICVPLTLHVQISNHHPKIHQKISKSPKLNCAKFTHNSPNKPNSLRDTLRPNAHYITPNKFSDNSKSLKITLFYPPQNPKTPINLNNLRTQFETHQNFTQQNHKLHYQTTHLSLSKNP